MSTRCWGRSIITLFGAHLVICAAAEEVTQAHSVALTEADFLGEIPTVLFASRLSQPLAEAPAAVTVIDRDMIKASGALEIAQLLEILAQSDRGSAFFASASRILDERLISGARIADPTPVGPPKVLTTSSD